MYGAGIKSSVAVPSKVHASQDSTKTQVTCSSKSVQRVFVWVEDWHPIPYHYRFYLFTIDPSIVRAVPVSSKTP